MVVVWKGCSEGKDVQKSNLKKKMKRARNGKGVRDGRVRGK